MERVGNTKNTQIYWFSSLEKILQYSIARTKVFQGDSVDLKKKKKKKSWPSVQTEHSPSNHTVQKFGIKRIDEGQITTVR